MSDRGKILNETREWLKGIDELLASVQQDRYAGAVDRLFANPDVPLEDINVTQVNNNAVTWEVDGEEFYALSVKNACGCGHSPFTPNYGRHCWRYVKDKDNAGFLKHFHKSSPRNIDAAKYQYEMTGVCVDGKQSHHLQELCKICGSK